MYVHELAVRSSVQVMLAPKETMKPEYWGTGFMLIYQERLFFVSVRHVVTYRDLAVLLETNLPSEGMSTPLKPLGGFCFFDLFIADNIGDIKDFEDLIKNPKEKIDVAFAEITEQFDLLQPEQDFGAFKIEAGTKLPLYMEDIGSPDKEHDYIAYGKIGHEYNGIYLKSTAAFKHNIKFHRTSGKFHLFLAPEKAINTEDYSGISGAPILDSDGRLVAIACKVLSGTKLIYGLSIYECKKLLDLAIDTKML